MSEEKKEELDPNEVINITREKMVKELNKAQENGSQIKYKVLMNFLFATCEFYADSFRPPNIPMYKFLGATLNTLIMEFEKKYGKLIEEEKNRQQSEEAPSGGHEDVQEGVEGGQKVAEGNQQEKEEVKP